MQVITGTSSYTVYFDELGAYLPCWCGARHRGDYMQEEWFHHHCAHAGELCSIASDQAICLDCGQSFSVEGGGDATNKATDRA